ncbi:MAG: hypothetical protein HYU29_08545 [Chloroflexi bacterium]|nr:hypothetical protein [Chloroflexota bacterium]
MRLPFQGPLDLATTLESGQAFRWRKCGQWHEGAVRDNLVRLRQEPLGLEFTSAPSSEEEVAPLLRSYLRLEDDLEAIGRQISRDAWVKEALRRHRGLRLLRQEPWECLASFICSANSNIGRITQTVETLAQHYGRPIAVKGQTAYAFPGPERVAAAGEAGLRELGLGFRARALAQAAVLVADGKISLEALRDKPYEEGKEKLMALPGVGDKVADCVLLFSLEKLEAFPIDRWVERALRRFYPEELPPEKKTLPYRHLSSWARSYFGPYAGYAQQYLYHWTRTGVSRSP